MSFESIPNDVIKEIVGFTTTTLSDFILAGVCFTMTCKKVHGYGSAKYKASEFKKSSYFLMTMVCRDICKQTDIGVTTNYIIGLGNLSTSVISMVKTTMGRGGSDMCSSRLFSALIKSNHMLIYEAPLQLPISWLMWAVRRIGINSHTDILRIIKSYNGDLLHEAIAHVSNNIDLNTYNLHSVVARCCKSTTVAPRLHQVLIDNNIYPTIDDLCSSFGEGYFISAKWIYEHIRDIESVDNNSMWVIYNHSWKYIETQFALNEYKGKCVKLLINIQGLVDIDIEHMIAFICYRLTRLELTWYIEYLGEAAKGIDYKSILQKTPITDHSIGEYLLGLIDGMGECGEFNDEFSD
jgi:hypothetical protein